MRPIEFVDKLPVWCILLLFIATPVLAQELPPCFERLQYRDPPWVYGHLHCLENVYVEPDGAELAITALTAAPDGTLYAARPLDGQVIALADSDGDLLPDSPQVVIDRLTLPNGLAYAGDALYIAGGPHLYRYADGTLDMLVDDLPVEPGGWAGDVVVGPDDRLYVSIPAPCDFCNPQRQGMILSYALDGTDRRVEAEGLRQAAGLAFRDGVLWATDSARRGLAHEPDLDELNRVTSGTHFGWPYCIGTDNQMDMPDPDFDCTTASPPAFTFPTGSTPLGLATYTQDVMPELNGALLVVLNGSRHQVDLQGYALVAVHFDAAGSPVTVDVLSPVESSINHRVGFTVEEMNYRGSGFWPRRPLDVVVSPEGWVYLSISGGQIIALRPIT